MNRQLTDQQSEEYDEFYDTIHRMYQETRPEWMDLDEVFNIMISHIFREATLDGTKEEQEEYLRELIAKEYKGWDLTP